ncbi:glycoside hydrolase family 65 protein [Companilactobacillus baiquanensis]|uniref:Glycoside hydrolase family 65 protein n=1 Tax=Companilactobacillus baiquanensis TaxID=2486005 RepID=A0ABW1UVV3_9LACO|nr:glycosyl hydrolase family 65 protein [Companilactobacillus baiquanensis]
MLPLYLTVTDKYLKYSYKDKDTEESIDKIYNLNPEIDLNANFSNFKSKVPDYFDIIVIMNPIDIEIKDTIVSCANQPVDISIYMENLFHIPTVGINDVKKYSLQKAAEIEKEYSGWHLDYFGTYKGKKQYGQESLLTVGNGYFGIRGAYMESRASDDAYPGTYVAGVYNQLTTFINNQDITNEDLVNLPNAQYTTFSIDDGEFFKLREEDIETVYRSLNMKNGILSTIMYISLQNGKKLKVTTKKMAHMHHFHSYSLQYTVEPLNFSGKIKIYTEIDGAISNKNVKRYRTLDHHHLRIDKTEVSDNFALLLAHTRNSHVDIAVSSIISSPNEIDPKIHSDKSQEKIGQYITFDAKENKSYTLEKTVSIYTSLETKGDLIEVLKANKYHHNFSDVIKNTTGSWDEIWKNEYLEIDGDITSQKLIRMNAYHLTITAHQNANKNLDVSVGSRGLHGEAYRGHIFWDELFVLPYYNIHSPKLVKSLLMYRYNRLNAAKKYASENGYQGAMYPWQSGMYGDEQSQSIHLNPITNHWEPDNSRKQRHVSLAVAYDVLNYYNMSDDKDFLQEYGLEMLLNIAKFWISSAKYNGKTNKYSIENVMGPDEFHEGYPGAKNGGLKNNAYTNIMTSWLFKKIEEIISKESSAVLQENFRRAHFSDEDLKKMNVIRCNLKLEYSKDEILGQFEGYFDLKSINFDFYRHQYGNISRMDRILKAEGDSPDNYQVAKQADALMPLYNLRLENFFEIMDDLGYEIDDKDKFIEKNIHYYLSRTTHGSTLSRIVYAMLALKVNDSDLAWKLFDESLTSDYYDIQGGTTAEGIHLGVMGATLNVVISSFAGIDYRGDKIEINPKVPKNWNSIKFNMNFKNVNYCFSVDHDSVKIKTDQDTQVSFQGQPVDIKANKERIIDYSKIAVE